ncbi:invasion associated locus B family protein [Bradyrhizobium guangdongense]|uniref:invasion associated locus B family protein n=1 Tax=Bradyrhizobium guangdongense TaxID=1325090 RepID=UPI001319D5CD|nr:invasion associated locus B family protein [Bradyrhizobium guangdongense]
MAHSHRRDVLKNTRSARAIAALAFLIAFAIPAVADIAPRGQRKADEIKYGAWQKLCFKAGGAQALCRTSITGTYETGQTAVRVDLIEREGEKTARLQLFVPVGMYLQAPVKLRVDQGAPHRVPYTWCLSNACIAGDAANPKLIREMEAGKTLDLEVVDNKLLSVTTSIPLAQFGSARKGPPVRTYEQEIDE